MDIGKLKNNKQYYQGYDGESEVILSIENHPEFSLHIWEGYFEDIFGTPISSDKGWVGFTRDYQEGIYTFSDEDTTFEIKNVNEYFQDLSQYRNRHFNYEETSGCLNLIMTFFKYATSISEDITVTIV